MPDSLPDSDAAGDELFEAVAGYTARAVDPLRERMGRLDADIATRPTVDSMRAAIAEASAKLALDFVTMVSRAPDGKPITIEDVRPVVERAIADLPKPKDGAPGKDADPAQVTALVDGAVAKAVAAIPAPKDGTPGPKGDAGDKGDAGERGAAGDPGADGKSVEPAAVEAMIVSAVERAVAVTMSEQQDADAAWAKTFADELVAKLTAATVE